MKKRRTTYLLMLIVWLGIGIWSAIHPTDRMLWFYEVTAAVGLVAVLVFTYRRFPWTPLTYIIVFISTVTMLIGGHYTYGHVPLFDHLKPLLHLKRNDFDRVGHVFQGMLVAVGFREYFFRKKIVTHKWWREVVAISISLAFSAAYELFELAAGFISRSNISEFLGEQGDRWDSHWDMASALLGAVLFVVLFRGWHNRQMARLEKEK